MPSLLIKNTLPTRLLLDAATGVRGPEGLGCGKFLPGRGYLLTYETSFHHFCEKFSAALWDEWVKLPVGDELRKVEEVFRRSGYPGAIGSTDCTHFKWDGGPFSEARINTGKEDYPSVAVEATCDHTGRIIAATKSYPGSENDKTIIARDKSIWRIQNEEPWSTYKYSLYNEDGSETEYTGA